MAEMTQVPDLTKIPLAPPPSGVEPNLINPTDTIQPVLMGITLLCLVLITIFTMIRIILKRMASSFALEDYLLMVSWGLFVAYSALVIVETDGGLGRNIWDVPASDGTNILKRRWVIEMLYCVLMFTAKAALIVQMRTIFAPQKSGVVHVASIVLLVANFLCYLASLISLLVECIPTEKIWNPRLPTGHCINSNALLVSTGGINIISDITILALPMWVIWNLKINLQTRISIIAIFSAGSISVVSAIGRFIYTIFVLSDPNLTKVFARITLWTLAEFFAIILCTCLPFMPKLFKMVKQREWRSKPSYQNYSDRSNGRHLALDERSRTHLPSYSKESDTKSSVDGETAVLSRGSAL